MQPGKDSRDETKPNNTDQIIGKLGQADNELGKGGILESVGIEADIPQGGDKAVSGLGRIRWATSEDLAQYVQRRFNKSSC